MINEYSELCVCGERLFVYHRACGFVAIGAYVEIYQHGAAIDPAFLKVMESAYEELPRVTAVKLDTATYKSKVRVYVSDAVAVSHVWKGYQHSTDRRLKTPFMVRLGSPRTDVRHNYGTTIKCSNFATGCIKSTTLLGRFSVLNLNLN